MRKQKHFHRKLKQLKDRYPCIYICNNFNDQTTKLKCVRVIYLQYVCFCNKYILLVRVVELGTRLRSAELIHKRCYTWVSIFESDPVEKFCRWVTRYNSVRNVSLKIFWREGFVSSTKLINYNPPARKMLPNKEIPFIFRTIVTTLIHETKSSFSNLELTFVPWKMRSFHLKAVLSQ